jgi:hypothetical protein
LLLPGGRVPHVEGLFEQYRKKEGVHMIGRAMRYMTVAAAVALILVLAAGPVLAQVGRPAPVIPGAPPAPSGVPPADKPPVEKITTGMLEGAVKKVDPGAGELHVSSGLFGVFRKTLEVSNDTEIQMNGQKGTLADLREGETVKASYESRDGKNFATRIEAMPAEEKAPRAATPPAGRATSPEKKY